MKKRIVLIMISSAVLASCCACGKTEDTQEADQSTVETADDNYDEDVYETEEDSEAVYEEATEEDTEALVDENDPDRNLQMSQECYDLYFGSLIYGDAQSRYDDYMEEYCDSDYDPDYEDAYYFSICAYDDSYEPMLLLTSDNNNYRNADKIAFCRFNYYQPDAGGSQISLYRDYMKFISNTRYFSMNMTNERLQMLRYGNHFYYSEQNSADGTIFETREAELLVKDYFDSVPVITDNTDYASVCLEDGRMSEIKWFSFDQIEEAEAYYSQFKTDEDHLTYVARITGAQ